MCIRLRVSCILHATLTRAWWGTQVVFADFFMSLNHGNGLFCAGELPGGCF